MSFLDKISTWLFKFKYRKDIPISKEYVIHHSLLKEKIEEEIENYLKKYPFHNLFSLYNLTEVIASEYGGTCSDRTIQFKKILNEIFQYNSVNIQLHRAFINGKKTHTILKIEIDKKTYFCDVGMGFPINRLLPSHKNIKFNNYGIKFKSVVNNNELMIYIDEGQGEQELMKIVNEVQNQEKIEEEISQRWDKRHELPFHNKLRYFFIHNNKYYQIKDNDLSFNSLSVKVFEDEK